MCINVSWLHESMAFLFTFFEHSFCFCLDLTTFIVWSFSSIFFHWSSVCSWVVVFLYLRNPCANFPKHMYCFFFRIVFASFFQTFFFLNCLDLEDFDCIWTWVVSNFFKVLEVCIFLFLLYFKQKSFLGPGLSIMSVNVFTLYTKASWMPLFRFNRAVQVCFLNRRKAFNLSCNLQK